MDVVVRLDGDGDGDGDGRVDVDVPTVQPGTSVTIGTGHIGYVFSFDAGASGAKGTKVRLPRSGP